MRYLDQKWAPKSLVSAFVPLKMRGKRFLTTRCRRIAHITTSALPSINAGTLNTNINDKIYIFWVEHVNLGISPENETMKEEEKEML